jgi:hypothetical protein
MTIDDGGGGRGGAGREARIALVQVVSALNAYGNSRCCSSTPASPPTMLRTSMSLVAVAICAMVCMHSSHYLWEYQKSGPVRKHRVLSPEAVRVQAIIDAKRHARIASLDLSYCGITSLEGLEFPGSLISLNLSHNLIRSLKGFKFPARLEALGLSYNQISSLKGIRFPSELRELHIEGNRL